MEELIIRERRLAFYLRNGLISTGVNALCFTVPYRILEFESGSGCPHSEDEIKDLYRLIYKTMLPPEMYKSLLRFKFKSKLHYKLTLSGNFGHQLCINCTFTPHPKRCENAC